MIQPIIFTGEKPKMEISDIFSTTMAELFQEDPSVLYLDADLMGSMKTKDIWKQYPNNVVNTGIQEANMIGVAAGYYLAGLKPYVHSFSPFASRRVFDQVFLSVGYAKKSVRIIGSDVGIMATYNGGTHMCFEDTAMMRTIPNSCVIDISDGAMFRAFLKSTKDRAGVTYFRTPRRDLPDIYSEDTQFSEGKGKILVDGSDVTVIASGIMVATAIEASKALKEQGISCRVVDIVTIKPLDFKLVEQCAKETRAIITAENHNVIGGLGSAVAEYLAETTPTRVIRVGIRDQYGQVGHEAYLREQYGLTVQSIINAVQSVIENKNMRKEIDGNGEY